MRRQLAADFMQQFLYFLPLPHGHDSLRDTAGPIFLAAAIFLGASALLVVVPGAFAEMGAAASWRT
jgi:hypothetical protein